jgi:hypothetical protein
LPTFVPSFGVVRLDKASSLGLIIIWSTLGLTLTALRRALGFVAEITAALTAQ